MDRNTQSECFAAAILTFELERRIKPVDRAIAASDEAVEARADVDRYRELRCLHGTQNRNEISITPPGGTAARLNSWSIVCIRLLGITPL